jgi:hypothetical protein
MNKVTINLQVFEPGIRGFQAEWDRPRKPTFRYGSDKVGEAAAEEAFFLTNAPLELLSKDQVNIIKHYKGHSLSVGDSVTVEYSDTNTTEEYLCDSIGWKKKE